MLSSYLMLLLLGVLPLTWFLALEMDLDQLLSWDLYLSLVLDNPLLDQLQPGRMPPLLWVLASGSRFTKLPVFGWIWSSTTRVNCFGVNG